MQLQHTPLSFILTTGLSKTQVFEAITCQLVGGQGKFPSPRVAQELKKSTKRALQNEKLQSSGALCLSLNYEAETTAAHRLSFFFFAFCCIRGTRRGHHALYCSLSRLHRESPLPLARTSINNYLALKLPFGKQSERTGVNFIPHEESVSGWPVVSFTAIRWFSDKTNMGLSGVKVLERGQWWHIRKWLCRRLCRLCLLSDTFREPFSCVSSTVCECLAETDSMVLPFK